jgi:putative heme-binding domain-containing protein
VGGGIYRIRRASAARPADPRGLTIDWKTRTADQVCDLLEDPRPAVTERAVEWLAQRGDAVTGPLVTTLFESSDYRARQNAVWVLARIGSENARMLLRQALGDDDAPVRQAALKSIADLRDAGSIAQLIEVLAHDEPALRREAATGLGRIGKASAVPVLLSALAEAADRFVEHAVIYALIEINDPAATRAGLASSNANVRRGALIALDQMDSQGLSREAIAPLLATDDLPLLRTLVDVLARHPEWADELTGTLRGWLAEPQPSPERLATIRGGVVALIGREDVQALVAGALRSSSTDVQTKLMLLEVAGAGLVDTMPASWIEGIRQNLSSANVDLARAAIAAAAIDAAPVADRLIAIGLDASRPTELRVAALVTTSRAKTRMPAEAFGLLVNQLTGDVGVRDRLAAAEALGRFELNAAQRGQVARLIRHCGPLEIGWLLRPFEGDTTAATGLLLVESLAAAPAVSSVPVESLRAVFVHYPSDVQAVAEQLFARQSPGESDRAARLNALATSIDGGDAAKGEDVFLGARAACAACHRIGSRGERIGPDLSKIGEVRSQRDLVEAIVFPSASLARGFESFRAVTKQGKVHGGLVVRETASAVYLRTADPVEIRVPRDELEELAPSTISIMPEGLDKVLSTAELADLVAYLQTLK